MRSEVFNVSFDGKIDYVKEHVGFNDVRGFDNLANIVSKLAMTFKFTLLQYTKEYIYIY